MSKRVVIFSAVALAATTLLLWAQERPVFRVKVDMACEGIPQGEIDALVTHVKKWSPVANTFTRPVNLEVSA